MKIICNPFNDIKFKASVEFNLFSKKLINI